MKVDVVGAALVAILGKFLGKTMLNALVTTAVRGMSKFLFEQAIKQSKRLFARRRGKSGILTRKKAKKRHTEAQRQPTISVVNITNKIVIEANEKNTSSEQGRGPAPAVTHAYASHKKPLQRRGKSLIKQAKPANNDESRTVEPLP